MSPYAPRITTIKVPVDKIGEVIGPKGKMINAITEETGASISIEDDGTVFVGATDGPSAQAAIDRINAIANPQLPRSASASSSTVVKTTDFGAFVSLLPGRDGTGAHLEAGPRKRVNKVEDVVKVGDKLRVEIADIDNRGKISLILVAEDGDGLRRHRQLMPRPSAADRSAVRRTVLPGGLRIVTEYVPSVRSASVGLWVNVGSRDEGTRRSPGRHTSSNTCCSRRRRRAPRSTSPGGRRGRRRTERVHLKGTHLLLRARLDDDLDMAVEVVSDVVLNGVCAPDDVELERDVVLEDRDARRRRRTPSATCSCRRCSAIARRPSGDRQRRLGLGDDPEPVALLPSRRYVPRRMVLTVAGNIDHDHVVALAKSYFRGRLVGDVNPCRRAVQGACRGPGPDADQPRLRAEPPDPWRSGARSALARPVGVVGAEHRAGRGLSSRLFQQIRETRGWPTPCTQLSTPSPTAARSRSTPDACRSGSTRLCG